MVKLDKEYKFHGPKGTVLSLEDLFEGKDQLIVYHFMFGPNEERGCHGCVFIVKYHISVIPPYSTFSIFLPVVPGMHLTYIPGEHIPDVRHLRSHDTSLAVVSRASFDKLDAWKKKVGWTFPWYSSKGSDFNYDFHATLDPAVCPIEYTFANAAELGAKGLKGNMAGEQPGLSVFFRQDGGCVSLVLVLFSGTRLLDGDISVVGYDASWSAGWPSGFGRVQAQV